MAAGLAVGAGIAAASLISGLMGGSGPAQVDPAVQAELQARGIDIAQYMANLEAAALGMRLPFEQDLAKYPISVQQELGKAYETAYGSTERAAIAMAEKAFTGQPTEATQTMLNDYASTAGTQMKAQEQNNLLRAAQGGLDKSSPAVQAQLAEQERLSREGMMKGQNQLAFDANQQDQQNAMTLLDRAQNSQRIAGMYGWNEETQTFDNVPQAPQTAGDRQMAGMTNQLAQLKQNRDASQGSTGMGSGFQRAALDRQIAQMEQQISAFQQNPANFGQVQHPDARNVGSWETQIGGDAYANSQGQQGSLQYGQPQQQGSGPGLYNNLVKFPEGSSRSGGIGNMTVKEYMARNPANVNNFQGGWKAVKNRQIKDIDPKFYGGSLPGYEGNA